MGYLPDNGLTVWQPGEQLTAAGLNDNFAALKGYVEQALGTALQPDPAVVNLEMRLYQIEARLERLEALVEMHARQRNEKEWAPLASLGGVLQRVDDLQKAVEAAIGGVKLTQLDIQAMHEDHHRRLARLEQQPVPATAEAFGKLKRAHTKSARQAALALGQAIGLRQEVAETRRIAEGHDRVANRLEFAPLATVAHLLERLMRLEEASANVPEREEEASCPTSR